MRDNGRTRDQRETTYIFGYFQSEDQSGLKSRKELVCKKVASQ